MNHIAKEQGNASGLQKDRVRLLKIPTRSQAENDVGDCEQWTGLLNKLRAVTNVDREPRIPLDFEQRNTFTQAVASIR